MAYIEDYIDDESLAALAEDEDEGFDSIESYDDEGWDDEDWTNDPSQEDITERRWRKYRSKRNRRGGIFSPRSRFGSPITRGLTGGVLRTPAGSAKFSFPKAVATQSAVKLLNKKYDSLKAAISRVDKNLDKNTLIVDKKINTVNEALKKSNQQIQQSMLIPMLMSKTPEIEKIKFEKTENELEIKADGLERNATAKFKAQDATSLLLPLMMTGSFGSNDSSNMMMMVLLLSGALDKK